MAGRKRWHVIADLIRREGLKIGVEVGVKIGRNIEQTIKACPWFHWYAVDPWDTTMRYQTWNPASHATHEMAFDEMAQEYPANITKIKAYSLDAAMAFDAPPVDLVFIDAMHTRESCSQDIAAWLPHIRPGGWMTGHDYHHPRFPGVTEAVDDAFDEVQTAEDYVWMVQV